MVHELLRQKVIQGRQIVPYAPWQIPVEALDPPDLRERVRQIKTGDAARRPMSVDTQTMILPGAAHSKDNRGLSRGVQQIKLNRP